MVGGLFELLNGAPGSDSGRKRAAEAGCPGGGAGPSAGTGTKKTRRHGATGAAATFPK